MATVRLLFSLACMKQGRELPTRSHHRSQQPAFISFTRETTLDSISLPLDVIFSQRLDITIRVPGREQGRLLLLLYVL